MDRNDNIKYESMDTHVGGQDTPSDTIYCDSCRGAQHKWAQHGWTHKYSMSQESMDAYPHMKTLKYDNTIDKDRQRQILFC